MKFGRIFEDPNLPNQNLHNKTKPSKVELWIVKTLKKNKILNPWVHYAFSNVEDAIHLLSQVHLIKKTESSCLAIYTEI